MRGVCALLCVSVLYQFFMSEEEWARVQGMTYSELRRSSSVGSFLDDAEKNYKD